jgi:hypothetical protein
MRVSIVAIPTTLPPRSGAGVAARSPWRSGRPPVTEAEVERRLGDLELEHARRPSGRRGRRGVAGAPRARLGDLAFLRGRLRGESPRPGRRPRGLRPRAGERAAQRVRVRAVDVDERLLLGRRGTAAPSPSGPPRGCARRACARRPVRAARTAPSCARRRRSPA